MQHVKDKRTHKSNEGSVLSFIRQGMTIEKIATRLKMPISTVRAVLKKLKATGTVTNLPERPKVSWLLGACFSYFLSITLLSPQRALLSDFCLVVS